MITLTPRVRMRQLREARGWSRAELARRASMGAGDVGKIEAGRVRPYPAQLSKLAAALEVTPAELEGAAETKATA